MDGKLSAVLVLGCYGHAGKDGFVECCGVSNSIIDLEELGDGTYERLVDFFDNACELFDRPMYNKNKISNTLNMVHRDYNGFPHTMLFNVQSFLKMHRKCGMYLILIMKEDYENE